MNLARSIILVAFGGLLLFLAIRRLRQQRLKERYVLLFLAAGLPFLVLAAWPVVLVEVSKLLNMNHGTVQLMAVAGFLIIIVLELLCIVTVQGNRISVLAQQVGILTAEMKSIQDEPDPEAAAPPAAVDDDTS